MRFITLSSALLACVLCFVACEQSVTQPTITPTAPTASTPPSLLAAGPPPVNWIGNRVVLAVSGPGARCGWGTQVGDKRTDVGWSISIDGRSIKLDQDIQNWPTDDTPYSGTLSGTQFEASYLAGDDYLRTPCQWRGGTLAGEFNSDFSGFEAMEVLTWGPPERETTVHMQWFGRRVVQ